MISHENIYQREACRETETNAVKVEKEKQTGKEREKERERERERGERERKRERKKGQKGPTDNESGRKSGKAAGWPVERWGGGGLN